MKRTLEMQITERNEKYKYNKICKKVLCKPIESAIMRLPNTER